jgi:hypothetical protein
MKNQRGVLRPDTVFNDTFRREIADQQSRNSILPELLIESEHQDVFAADSGDSRAA